MREGLGISVLVDRKVGVVDSNLAAARWAGHTTLYLTVAGLDADLGL